MKGIDVSVFQRTISWQAIKAAGIEFAYLKATEGVGFTDVSFARHKAEAQKVGIPVGAYHFARPDTNVSAQDPIAEADWFVDVVRPAKGDLLPALDFETPGLPPAKMLAWAQAWLDRVRERTGVQPLFYVAPGFWDKHLRGTTPFPECPLWLAHWGPNDGQPHPADPIAGWPAVTVHQFTSKGTIAGFGGPLDLNELPGALKAITIGVAAPTPVPVPVPPGQKVLCYPHPAGPGVTIGQGLHETGGIPGNWAFDFMAPGGWPVLASCDATVSRFSGHDPATGLHPNAQGDVFGWSLYLKDSQGRTYFLTHLGSRTCQVGQRVTCGQQLGTVGNWPNDPGRSHTHEGVTSPAGATQVAQSKARITAISTAPKLPT